MAGKISELTAASTLTGAEKLECVQGGNSVRTTAQGIADLVSLAAYATTAAVAAGYQPLDADLTAIAALTTTSFGRGLLTSADAAAGRAAIGLGTLATQSGTFSGTHSGTSSGTNTGDQTSVTGNAGTATALATPRAINGVNFDGTAAITVTAAGSTLSDTVTIAKGGTGQTSKAAAFDALQPMTTSGDIIYGGASGTGTRLAKGSDGQALILVSGLPAWSTLPGGGDALTANPLSQFAATTSLQLKGVISDETGSGALVFADSPALAGTPTAPTASGGTNTTQIATTAFVAAGFQPLDSDLTAIAALTTTSYGRAFLALADAAAGRSALSLGTLATQSGTFSGTSSGTNTGDQTTVSGNAGTATALATARAINGVNFDGTAAIATPATIPQNSKSADYTLVLADANKHVYHPSTDNNARTFTIPANGSVAYDIGTTLTFANDAATSSTIAITTDTLVLAGTGTTGSRTLAQYGVATALKVTSTRWLISGVGLT